MQRGTYLATPHVSVSIGGVMGDLEPPNRSAIGVAVRDLHGVWLGVSLGILG